MVDQIAMWPNLATADEFVPILIVTRERHSDQSFALVWLCFWHADLLAFIF